MIYSQLRKKIEQERRQFKNSLQQLQSINSSPKVYQPYEPSNAHSSPKQTSETKLQQQKDQKALPPSKSSLEVQGQLITKLKQLTEIKREDKMAKITSELEHFCKKNSVLNTQLAQLKQIIEEKDKEMLEIESGYKEKLIRSAEKQSKIQQQQTNLKSIIKELRTILQTREENIVRLEGEVYELKKQREEKMMQFQRQTELNGEIKDEKQKLQNNLYQIKESISIFMDNVVNKINLFNEPILKIIQLKTEVINKDQSSLFFQQLQAKIKAMKQNNESMAEQIAILGSQIQKIQRAKVQALKQLQEVKIREKEQEKDLVNKAQSINGLQLKFQELLNQNQGLKLKKYLISQQFSQKYRQMQERQLSLSKQLEILQENLSQTEGELIFSRKNELQKQEKLHYCQKDIQKIILQKDDLQKRLDHQMSLNEFQMSTFKQQLSKLQSQNQTNLLKIEESQRLNQQLSQRLQSLSEKLSLKQEQLQKQAEKLRQFELSQKRLAEQNEKELHQVILLNAELDKYKIECKRYQNQKEQLEAKAKTLENENQQLKYHIEKLSTEKKLSIQEAKFKEQKIQQLKTQINEKIACINGLECSINELKSQIHSAIMKKQAILPQIQAKNQIIESCNNEEHIFQAENPNVQAKQKQQQANNCKENEISQAVQKVLIQPSIQSQKSRQNQYQLKRKIQLLVNQVKDKVQEIKSLRNEMIKQSQLYEKQKSDLMQDYSKLLKKSQQFAQLKKHYEAQKESYKSNYIKIEANVLLLQTKNHELQLRIRQKITQNMKYGAQNDLLRQDIQLKQVQMVNIVEFQEKKLVQSKLHSDLQLKSFSQFISNIKRNCLKNNCDSVGIISIQLTKVLNLEYKNLELISSPTDFQRFNKVEEIHMVQEFQLQYEEKQAQNKQLQQQSSEERKKVKQTNNAQDTNHAKLESQTQNTKFTKILEVKSVDLIEQQQQKQVKSASKQDFSLQNNPDVPQIVLPYTQLLQKYRDLKSDLQRMQEYICHVHSVNFKIKKGISETDQHNKHSSIDKISEKLTLLVKHNQAFLKSQTQQFTNEIGKILAQIQNYIHFVDQISKIQTLPHCQYNKNQHKFNKLKRKVTQHPKIEKEGIDKHAYSEGDSREDEYIDHFDAYFYEQDQDFPNIESQPKEIYKKQQQGMQRYFEENRQLYSQISSVKNKSLKSHNSFLNSRSQLWPLGAYLKNKFVDEFQQHQHQAIKKQSNDSERLSQMSIKEIKSKYHKLKKVNRSLNKQKTHLQKQCKKLETQENDFKKKISKMTKEFNESFKFLCQISGKQLHNQKQKLKVITSHQKQAQIQTMVSPRVLKICRLLERDEIIKKPEDSNNQGKLKEKETKQLQILNQALKLRVKQLQNKREQVQRESKGKIQYLELKLKKYQEQFASFVKKSLYKATVPPQNEQAPQRIVLQRDRAFRKNSNSYKEVEVSVSPPREEPISIAEIYQILSKLLNFQKNSQMSEKLNIKQFEQIISKSIQKIKKNAYLELVGLVLQYLQKFTRMYSQQECMSQLDKLHTGLSQYFDQVEKMNQLFVLAKELVPAIKRQSDTQVVNLSVHSHCDELKRPSNCSQKSIQKQSDIQSLDQERATRFAALKRQLQLLRQQNLQLQEQLSSYSSKIQQKSKLIQLQAQQYEKSKIHYQKEKNSIENQNKLLREQLEKNRPKGKKSKIYQINF